MSYTSALVHDLLREGFDRSPMFNGRIKSVGPRYCPSIEDKINRFADKDRHQLFVEPEGWNTCEYYINGFSTSLPEDVQFKALRSVVGFEKSRAEYRTLLRQDNADFRLTPKGYKLGLASKKRLERMEEKQSKSDAFVQFFKDTSVKPDEANPVLESKNSARSKQKYRLNILGI